jgi:hypothetical protein
VNSGLLPVWFIRFFLVFIPQMFCPKLKLIGIEWTYLMIKQSEESILNSPNDVDLGAAVGVAGSLSRLLHPLHEPCHLRPASGPT